MPCMSLVCELCWQVNAISTLQQSCNLLSVRCVCESVHVCVSVFVFVCMGLRGWRPLFHTYIYIYIYICIHTLLCIHVY